MEEDIGGMKIMCELQCAEFLGAGTSGSVHGLGPSLDGKRYAVKQVTCPEETGVPSPGQLAECRLHASLPQHNALLGYRFSWVHSQKLYILLERVDSELWDALEGGESSAAVDAAERTEWARQLLSAVACLHAHGVAHRDISPWNCFLVNGSTTKDDTSTGESASVAAPPRRELKLGDFGLAVRVPPTGSPASLGGLFGMETDGCAPLDESAIGSLYSAPEVCTYSVVQ